MEEYVYVEGKKYRRGYTTGTSAAAATKAAMWMFATKCKIEDRVKIHTPKGVDIFIEIENSELGLDYAQCSVKKDGGDDIDVTHGMDIFSRIELIDRESDVGSESKIGQVNMNKLDGRIRIRSGIGIGRVTKPGLGIEIGRPAINQVPIEMIVKSVEEVVMECDLDMDEFLGDKSIDRKST